MKFLIVSNKQRLNGYIEFAEALKSLGIEANCVNTIQSTFLTEFKPFHIIPVPKLLRLIKRLNTDIVMTDSAEYLPHMAKLVNRKVFFHMRGEPWSETCWEKAMHPSLFVRMYKHYLAKISSIRNVDIILPNSKWLQKRVKQHLPNHPTQVLYVGIDAEKWVPSDNNTFDVKHPAVLGVFPFGTYIKALGFLKFTEVVRKMPDLNFYFAGDGPYLNLIRKNCPPNMFLIGKVSRFRVKELLDSCDIFVHPSGSDSLPRSVKEACLMEKPVVASNEGGIPEIVKNNETGYLCTLNEVDQWIEKIRFLLDNPGVAKKFGKNARKFVMERFDWRKIAQSFVRDLEDFER